METKNKQWRHLSSMSHGEKILNEIKPLIQKFHALSEGNIECIGMLFRFLVALSRPLYDVTESVFQSNCQRISRTTDNHGSSENRWCSESWSTWEEGDSDCTPWSVGECHVSLCLSFEPSAETESLHGCQSRLGWWQWYCWEVFYIAAGTHRALWGSYLAHNKNKFKISERDVFQVVKKVMAGLHDTMVTFHTKVGGDISKIEALFVDMAPEPQKGKPMPPGRISRLVLGLFLLTCLYQEWFMPFFVLDRQTPPALSKIS